MRATGGRQKGAGIGKRGVNEHGERQLIQKKSVEICRVLKYDESEKMGIERGKNDRAKHSK